jgi:TolB protein
MMSTKKSGMSRTYKLWMPLAIVLLMGLVFVGESSGDGKIGIFEGSNDIGVGILKGAVAYDSTGATYKISGSGENMWFDHDAFQFVWKKMSGDAVISADVNFLGEGKNPHRKAVVIIRQSLDADSAYVDVARHGEGLTSLQYRDAKGATTHEVQANISGPKTIRLEKHGDYFSMLLAPKDGKMQVAGGSIRVPIQGDYYIGIGVCSHEKEVVETAVFSNVNVALPTAGGTPTLYSTLETISIESTDRRVVHVAA